MKVRNRNHWRRRRGASGPAWPNAIRGTVLILSLAVAVAGFGQPRSEWSIVLDSRTFVPRPGIEARLLGQARSAPDHLHALVQLDAAADPILREALISWGIDLERQLGRRVWTATVTRLVQPLPEGVRWLGSFRPEDRLSAEIRGRVDELAWAPPDEAVVLRVAGHAQCAEALERWIGRFGTVLDRPKGRKGSYLVSVYPHFVGALAEGPHVRAVAFAAARGWNGATRGSGGPAEKGRLRVSPSPLRDR